MLVEIIALLFHQLNTAIFGSARFGTVPVIIVRDRGKHTCDAVLTDRSARGILKKIGHYISQESILCIDKSRALIKFAKKSGMASKHSTIRNGVAEIRCFTFKM